MGRAAPRQAERERAAMRRAVELARHGLGRTRPNPVVGAVVLAADGTPVGEGWHARAGAPHAEAVALAAAGDRARGGTAVVTLEPCTHTGRTPPCTEALLAAGIARVVYAVADPDPRAAGGAEVLRRAGVDVEAGVLAEDAEAVNEAWLHAVRHGRPFVTWKYAASLDGQVAAADGSSQWITSADARADVHRLRAESDAVVVGIGTVLADDPLLTVRDRAGRPADQQPVRVVVDSAGRTPAGARLRATGGVLAHADDLAQDRARDWPDTLPLPRSARGLDLGRLLDALDSRGLRSVLVEGGPTLAGSFLDEGLVDRVVGYVAPVLLGSGRWPALRGHGAASLADAGRWRLDDVTRVGPDVRLTARPAAGGR